MPDAPNLQKKASLYRVGLSLNDQKTKYKQIEPRYMTNWSLGGDAQTMQERRDFSQTSFGIDATIPKFRRHLDIEPYVKPDITDYLREEHERLRKEAKTFILVGGDEELSQKLLSTTKSPKASAMDKTGSQIKKGGKHLMVNSPSSLHSQSNSLRLLEASGNSSVNLS